MCGAGFSARADAVYCSSACRQKAHRARSARRVEVLRQNVVRRATASEQSRSLQRTVAGSMQRARQQLDRSRELCRVSELRLQESAALRRATFSAISGTGRA